MSGVDTFRANEGRLIVAAVFLEPRAAFFGGRELLVRVVVIAQQAVQIVSEHDGRRLAHAWEAQLTLESLDHNRKVDCH